MGRDGYQNLVNEMRRFQHKAEPKSCRGGCALAITGNFLCGVSVRAMKEAAN
jgi:hypothetical protein